MNWKMIIVRIVAAFVLVAGTASAARAAMPLDVATETAIATLVDVKGSVQVIAGVQSVSGTAGMKLNIGARVMALAGSAVTLQFNNGCRCALKENELLTIEYDSPCCLAGSLPQEPAAAPASATGVSSGLVFVPPAAAVVVGIVGALLDGGGDGDPRPPISP